MQKGLAAIVVVFLLCAANAFAGRDAKLAGRVDDYLAPIVKSGDFNGAVLIARGGQIVVRKNYGQADWDLHAPLVMRSRFRIASITKTFTGAAVATLAERGKLSFTDPLSKYLPDFPNGQKILIRHLLLHEAGVGNPGTPTCANVALADLIADLSKRPLSFEPGTKSSYSNGGYVLLAAVIEKASGKAWQDFLRDEIFKPLHLDDTVMDSETAVIPMRVHGFVPGSGAAGVEHAVCEGAWGAIGSGALLSSAGDLYRWGRAVRNDTLFKRTALEYPYGWGERKYFERRAIEQSGEVNGSTSYLAAYLDDDLYVVVLSNLQGGTLTDIGKGLAALALGVEPPPLKPSPAVLPSTAEERGRWVGRYENKTQGYSIELTEKGGALYLRWGDSPATVFISSTGRSKAFNRQNSVAMELSARADVITMRWSEGIPQVFNRLP